MAALIDCNCNSPTCDCCINKPTTVQTATTTLVTPTYFNDKSYSGLTDEQIRAKIDVTLDVSAALTLFNTNIINNAVFDKTDFPFVQERIAQGPISQTEYREFLKDYNYTVDVTTVSATGETVVTEGTVTTTIKTNPRKHMEHFNNFLKLTIAGVAVSSICQFLSDPFNKINDTLSQFSGFLGGFKSLKDLIDGLQNPLDAITGFALGVFPDFPPSLDDIQAKLSALSIKKFAQGLIDSVADVVNSIKDKVANIAESVSKAIGNIIGLQGKNKLSINAWFSKQFANIQNALSEGNIANLTKNIATTIAQAASGLIKLTLGAIEQLLFLFCKMATQVENSLMALLNPVQTAADRIANTTASLATGSGDATRNAVEAGRPVVEPTALAAQCQSYVDAVNAAGTNSSNPANPSFEAGDKTPIIAPSNYSSHPDPTSWSNLTFLPKVLNNQFFATYGDLRLSDSGGGVINVKAQGITTAIGYYGLDLHVIEMMNEVGKIMGLKLNVNSGFRHPYYNQYLRNTTSGVAKNSQHMSGKAMDIGTFGATHPRRLEFLTLCKKIGFQGFGYYKTFTHCDVGAKRHWNTSLAPRGFSPY